MGSLIGQILPFAVGVALSPVPVIAVILIMFTPRARVNSLAFLVGWLLGLAVVGGIALAIVDTTAGGSGEQTASGVIKLVLGILMLLLAVRNWRSRPGEGEKTELPGWTGALDKLNAVKSLGIAAALSGINPKNLVLTVAAATTIAAAQLGTGESAISLAAFVIIASLTVGIPVIFYLVMKEKADAGLNRLKDWLSANNAAVMAVLFLIFAAKLIGDGISALAG
jgi:hypothetical protein